MRPSRSGRSPAPSDSPAPPEARGTSAPRAPSRARVWRGVILGATVLAVVAYFLGRDLWADHQLAAAERAQEQRNFPEARIRLDKYRSVRGDSLESLLLAARIARRARAYPEAESHLRTIRQQFPADKSNERELLLLRIQLGNPTAVETALTQALARGDAADPWELEAAMVGDMLVLLQAFVHHDVVPGRPAYALAQKSLSGANLWLRLRPAAPDQAEGLFWRGLLYGFLNDRASAPADFRAALALDPTHRDARFRLGESLRYEAPLEALGHLELLRQQYPNDTEVQGILAEMYRDMGRIEEAAVLFDELLAAEPTNVDALRKRGSIALDQGQFDRAEKWLSQAQKLAPDDLRTNFELAACLRATGRTVQAKTYHDNYLRIRDAREKPTEPAVRPMPKGPR